jgi:hypothetical protein
MFLIFFLLVWRRDVIYLLFGGGEGIRCGWSSADTDKWTIWRSLPLQLLIACHLRYSEGYMSWVKSRKLDNRTLSWRCLGVAHRFVLVVPDSRFIIRYPYPMDIQV